MRLRRSDTIGISGCRPQRSGGDRAAVAQLLRISRTCREFFGFQFHYPTMKLGRNSAKFLEARALGASVVGMAVISDDTCDDPGEWINWAPFFFASSMPSEDHRGWLGEPRTPDTKKVSLGGMSESGGGTSGSEGLAATARRKPAARETRAPEVGRGELDPEPEARSATGRGNRSLPPRRLRRTTHLSAPGRHCARRAR